VLNKNKKTMTQTALIADLESRLQAIIRLTEQELQPLSAKELNWKASAKSWSMLECLAHLNRYFEYYNAQLHQRMVTTSPQSDSQTYQSTWLGKQVINSIDPQNVKKSRTLPRYNPANSQLDATVIPEFLQHLQVTKSLLKEARGVNLRQKRIPVEFFKLLKLSVGDTLIILVYHAQQHLNQALGVKDKLSKSALTT